MTFRTELGQVIFNEKYRNSSGGCRTWADLVDTLVYRVCHNYMRPGDMSQLTSYMRNFKFIPAGRYLYYAGRPASFFNNCFAFIAEDSREGWAKLAHNHMLALMCGGGVGTYYGAIRPKGSPVKTTGGVASGPVPLMHAMNEVGRNVMQGGARRSALYASLPCDHPDIYEFMSSKNWDDHTTEMKSSDFNFPGPLDMTNISVAYNDLTDLDSELFRLNILQAIKTGEPGFQFDFGAKEEVGRNACTEFITDTDSDMCNLGSINMANIKSPKEMESVAYLASQFLYCGSLMAQLPYKDCYEVRSTKRKIGLGIMGLHEWIMKNGGKYEPSHNLFKMLYGYKKGSKSGADDLSDTTSESRCIRYRSIAPSGTISLLAGTTSGIEPLYSVAIKRRWFDHGDWKYQYVIDPIAKQYIEDGLNPNNIETASDLSNDIDRRLGMQSYIQNFVDMGISSTVNIQSDVNVDTIERSLRNYAPSLRGVTFYPDGARGGQPLVSVPWEEAQGKEGITLHEQVDILENTACKGGVCGI